MVKEEYDLKCQEVLQEYFNEEAFKIYEMSKTFQDHESTLGLRVNIAGIICNKIHGCYGTLPENRDWIITIETPLENKIIVTHTNCNIRSIEIE